MESHIVISKNPFDLSANREIITLTDYTFISDIVPVTNYPFIVLCNGEAILRERWKYFAIGDGCIINILYLPQGGGGGGSSPLRILSMIAVTALAVMAPELMALYGSSGGIIEGIGISAMWSPMIGALVSGSILFAGSALINALMPPPATGVGGNLPTASPTYSIQAQGNAARIGAAIPVQYGKMCFYPDYAALPYTNYIDNQEYLYQIFTIGFGEYDIENIYINDTSIDSFSEVDYEILPPGTEPTLFPYDVYTSPDISGLQLLGSLDKCTFVKSGTTITITVVYDDSVLYPFSSGDCVYLEFTSGSSSSSTYGIDYGVSGSYMIAGGRVITYYYFPWSRMLTPVVPSTSKSSGGKLYIIDEITELYDESLNGMVKKFTVVDSESATDSGTCRLISVAGRENGFTLNPPFTKGKSYEIDIQCPGGLYQINGDGNIEETTAQYITFFRYIDDYDNPISDWIVGGINTLTNATTSSVRESYSWTSFPRVQMKMGRYNKALLTSTGSDQLVLSSAKTYYSVGATPALQIDNVTRLAVKIRATNNISSQSANKVNVVATRKLQAWNGTSFDALAPTSSIAWTLADACLNTQYGYGIDQNRVDLESLLDLDSVWSLRGDEFNGRFDNTITFWQALCNIAIVGRCKPYIQSGIIRFARDQEQSSPVAMFTSRNIVKGSFQIEYLFPTDNTVGEIDVTYFNIISKSPLTVTTSLPPGFNVDPDAENGQIDFTLGITNRDQALREASYQAACNLRRRKLITFTTEMEGFIPSIGDLISVSHDMPAWGQSAEVIDYDDEHLLLYLDSELDWSGSDFVIFLRKLDGSPTEPVIVTQGDTADIIVLPYSVASYINVSGDKERNVISFGTNDAFANQTWRQPAKVISLSPSGINQVKITAINEDTAVYYAERDIFIESINCSQLSTYVPPPTVYGTGALSGPGIPSTVVESSTAVVPLGSSSLAGPVIPSIGVSTGIPTGIPDYAQALESISVITAPAISIDTLVETNTPVSDSESIATPSAPSTSVSATTDLEVINTPENLVAPAIPSVSADTPTVPESDGSMGGPVIPDAVVTTEVS